MMRQKFYNWANKLGIISKEKGVMNFSPKFWFTGQKYVIDEIFKEIESKSPKRNFYILKARQLGITTVLNALDLFWVMVNRGIKLGFLCHNYEARPRLRERLRTMYLSLPREAKIPITIDNREMMHFANASEIIYMHVSSKETTRQAVARSQDITCLHSTETAFYDINDPEYETLKSLLISMSKHHEARWTIFETTANGFNEFYDWWREAKNSKTEKTIFVAWWMREDYSISKKDPLFKEFGYPPTIEERRRIELVKKMYQYEISIEQLAWFRKEMLTTFKGDFNYALQELPWYEDEAFRVAGYLFFDPFKITELKSKVDKVKPMYFDVYVEKDRVYIDQATKNSHNLEIYELPQPNAHYFIGADPTWGSSATSDNAVISVWKGYKNKIIQVAEYVDTNVDVTSFAKICLLISAIYKNSYLNVEIQGPGMTVLNEINQLRKNPDLYGNIIWNIQNKEICINSVIENVKRIKEYLYRRPDTMSGGFVKHWSTNQSNKQGILSQLNGLLKIDMVEIKSVGLWEEMKNMIKDNTYIGAPPGRTDDRVMAAAIAIEHWRRHWYYRLPEEGEASTTSVELSQKEKELKLIGIYEYLKPYLAR